MAKLPTNLNSEVTSFLDKINHPLRNEIDLLRNYIITANKNLTENIKWNGPNYCFKNEDRITIRIQPPTIKQIQIIFHCGTKAQEQPKERLLQRASKLLTWKTNDRAFIAFKSVQEIEIGKFELNEIVNEWINATK